MSIAAYQGVCPTCRHDHSEPVTALASGSGDHAELARLAEAATPGEWELDGHQCLSAPDGTIVVDYSCCGRGEWEADAAYLRAVQPPRVLSLLAGIATLRESLTKANDGFEEYERKFYLEQDAREEAERKLAEAGQVIRDIAETPYTGADWPRSRAATYLVSKEAERG